MTGPSAASSSALTAWDGAHRDAAAPVLLLGELLARVDSASAAGFYAALCEAACRTASLTRAVAVLRQGDGDRLRVVGACGIERDGLLGTELRPGPRCPILRSLRRDAVLEGAWPESCAVFREAFGQSRLVSVPLVAGSQRLGAVVADRGGEPLALTPSERRALWVVGKAAAVAAAARAAGCAQELAYRREDALALGRRIHDGVAQRIFGVSALLAGAERLGDAERALVLAELDAARQELGDALESALDAPAPRHGLEPEGGAAALCASVLAEALRNIAKHARYGRIAVWARAHGDAIELAVVNDGRGDHGPAHSGIGLRLAREQATRQGAVLEFGPEGPDGWAVRLRAQRRRA